MSDILTMYKCSEHNRFMVLINKFGMRFWACPVIGCLRCKPCKSGKKNFKRRNDNGNTSTR